MTTNTPSTANTIRQRIDELAGDLLARINLPGYETFAETLGGEVHHLVFGGVDADPGGRVFPENSEEWLEVRTTRFEQLLKDHCEDRLDKGYYENPIDGMAAAVSATLADLVADRVIELNDGYNTPLPTPGPIDA